jgi:molybdopterin molybdotransferase
MPTFDEARRLILSRIATLGVERVSLLDATLRVLAEDIVAPWCMPLSDTSAMDGFAVRAVDCAAPPTDLRVTGYIPAGGEICGAVEPGCAIRIMTGAPIPPGCDGVVPIEETDDHGDRVTLLEPVKSGQHIRITAEDVRAGETIITAGTLLRSPEISMLASFGKALVPVYRRARVAILSTGDELIELGETPGHGKIINSNILSLAASLREIGAEPVLLGIALDNRESHLEKMAEGLKADAFITSAGVSAGDRDLVRDLLAELGVEQLFWKVEMKPGGPTAVGLFGGKPVFSLPGNPVSTMVTFEAFARPALLKMMGHRRVFRPVVTATLMNDLRKKPGKMNLIRVALERGEGGFRAYSSGVQQTAMLKTMLRADALAVFPAELDRLEQGATVQCHLVREELFMGESSG